MGVDLCELVRNSFVDVAEELKDSVVFVDKHTYDVIEWTVGVAFLVGLGIRSIDITSDNQQYVTTYTTAQPEQYSFITQLINTRNVLSSSFFLDDNADLAELKLIFFTSK